MHVCAGLPGWALWNVGLRFAGRIRESRAAQGIRKEGLREANRLDCKPQLSSVKSCKFPYPVSLSFPGCDRRWCRCFTEGPEALPAGLGALARLATLASVTGSAPSSSHHPGPAGFSSFLFCKFPLHCDDMWKIHLVISPEATQGSRTWRWPGSPGLCLCVCPGAVEWSWSLVLKSKR